MSIKKLTAFALALCMLFFSLSALPCVKAEEAQSLAEEMIEEVMAEESTVPQSNASEAVFSEEIADEPVQSASDEVIVVPEASDEEIIVEEEVIVEDEVILIADPEKSAPVELPEIEEKEQVVTQISTYRPARDYGEGPVYVLENGARHFGEPEEFIPLDKTIYLYNYFIIEINGYSIQELKDVRFALGGGFSRDDAIYLSASSPSGRTKADAVFLWAGPDVGERENSYRLREVLTATEEDYLETEIMVQTAGYTADEPCTPAFSLTAIPEPAQGMMFAVTIDGGDPQILTDRVFVPTLSGDYRFLLLDADGAEAARSKKYPVEILTVSEMEEEVIAGDEVFVGVPSLEEDEEVHMDFSVEEDEGEIAIEIVETTETVVEDTMELYAGAEIMEEEYLSDAVVLPGSGIMAEVLEEEIQSQNLLVEQLDEGVFQLYGLPDDGQHMYTVQFNGGTPVSLLSSTYTAAESGDYVFAICDLSGAVVESSDLLTVVLAESPADAADTPAADYVLSAQIVQGEISTGWSNQPIAFALSASPALAEGHSYAFFADGVLQDTFTDDSFTLSHEGDYTLEFAIVDADGHVLASSAQTFDIKLDLSAPLLIATPLDNYILRIVVGDVLSHGSTVKISTDGGQTFTPGMLKYQDEGVSTCEFVASKAIKLDPGTIIVADAAGNTTSNTAPVTLYSSMEQLKQMSGMASLGSFGGFSRGGFGGSYRSVSHSESDVDDVTAYNAVRLIVDDGSMTQLKVGDEVLDLELQRDSFLVTEELPAPTFTAAFTAWDGNESSGVDTLILTASDPQAADGSYTWSFSGVVYKKLAASGIDYLVLRIGDNVTALSTAGFSAGIRYNMYRAEGLPSKEFRYDVRMGAPGSAFEMDVTVSGETYRMSADPTAEFYYYDVYNGSADQFGVLAEG